MGKKVFEQISGTLAPFKEFLADAIRRRSSDIWQRIPTAYAILQAEPLATFWKPLSVTLSPEHTFQDAVGILCTDNSDFCCVLVGENRLKGIVTRTDIFHAVDAGVRPWTMVSEFMNQTPVCVAINDSSIVVAGTMRELNLKWVPVINNVTDMHVVGYVRRDGMIGFVLQKLTAAAM
jgi:signal-transduction protein with cAMP-binding, CBS, and nucleotidyltransferase domain